jgi:hypothetical protein
MEMLVDMIYGNYKKLYSKAVVPDGLPPISIVSKPMTFKYIRYGHFVCTENGDVFGPSQPPSEESKVETARKNKGRNRVRKLASGEKEDEEGPSLVLGLYVFPTMYVVDCGEIFFAYPLTESNESSLFSSGDFTISSTDLLPITSSCKVFATTIFYDVPARPINPDALPQNEFFTQKILFESNPNNHLPILRNVSLSGIEYRQGHTRENYTWLYENNGSGDHSVLIEGRCRYMPPKGTTVLSIHSGEKSPRLDNGQKHTPSSVPCGILIELSETTLSEALPKFKSRLSWKTLLSRLSDARFGCNVKADLYKPISL